LRAESLSEVPVIGRMIAASDRRAHASTDALGGEAESGASLLPFGDPESDAERENAPLAPHHSERS
jgi:hypothetical protein